MADQLVTVAELASFLQQDVDTATATLLIEMATGKVQDATGQILIAGTCTAVIDVDVFDPCSTQAYEEYLDLPQSPVRSVSSVEPVALYRNVGFKLGRWHDVGYWQRELRAPQGQPAEPRTFGFDAAGG